MENQTVGPELQNTSIEKKDGFVKNHIKKLQLSMLNLLLTVFLAIILMFVVAFAVFNMSLKGEEQVMVPNVVGKELGQALLEMQEKELYPKVQFRYTDDPNDAGKILSQSPEASAIVKAGRRINLVISRGVVLDYVENYVGMTYDEVKSKIQAMFAGSANPLIILEEPSYKADSSPFGTVIAQSLPQGTSISSPVTIKLIVSKGAEYETVKIPNLVGLSVDKVYKLMENTKLIFDFTSHNAVDGERVGTITKQQEVTDSSARIYTHLTSDLAIPSEDDKDKAIGIFSKKISKYPFAVEMSLESKKDGKKVTLVKFYHIGGNVTVPYSVAHGSELILVINGKNVEREFID